MLLELLGLCLLKSAMNDFKKCAKGLDEMVYEIDELAYELYAFQNEINENNK